MEDYLLTGIAVLHASLQYLATPASALHAADQESKASRRQHPRGGRLQP
jgi:hypothetical protein